MRRLQRSTAPCLLEFCVIVRPVIPKAHFNSMVLSEAQHSGNCLPGHDRHCEGTLTLG